MAAPVIPVSVVVSTRNRASLLEDLVQSICEGLALPAEIIVADQSDVSSTAARLQAVPGVGMRHLHLTRRGVSRGRNAGAAIASEAVIAFIDDDMRASPAWLTSLTRPLLDGEPGTVTTGRVVAGPAEAAGAFVSALADSDASAQYRGRLSRDVLAGGNMAIRAADFRSAGGFDERIGPGTRFPAAEDNDLGLRLLQSGLHIAFVPAAVAEHRAWRPSGSYVPLRFDYGRGKGAFYMKHARAGDLHTLRRMGRDLCWRGWRSLRLALHPRLAAGEVAYAAGLLRGATEWASCRCRNGSHASRRHDTRALYDHSPSRR